MAAQDRLSASLSRRSQSIDEAIRFDSVEPRQHSASPTPSARASASPSRAVAPRPFDRVAPEPPTPFSFDDTDSAARASPAARKPSLLSPNGAKRHGRAVQGPPTPGMEHSRTATHTHRPQLKPADRPPSPPRAPFVRPSLAADRHGGAATVAHRRPSPTKHPWQAPTHEPVAPSNLLAAAATLAPPSRRPASASAAHHSSGHAPGSHAHAHAASTAAAAAIDSTSSKLFQPAKAAYFFATIDTVADTLPRREVRIDGAPQPLLLRRHDNPDRESPQRLQTDPNSRASLQRARDLKERETANKRAADALALHSGYGGAASGQPPPPPPSAQDLLARWGQVDAAHDAHRRSNSNASSVGGALLSRGSASLSGGGGGGGGGGGASSGGGDNALLRRAVSGSAMASLLDGQLSSRAAESGGVGGGLGLGHGTARRQSLTPVTNAHALNLPPPRPSLPYAPPPPAPPPPPPSSSAFHSTARAPALQSTADDTRREFERAHHDFAQRLDGGIFNTGNSKVLIKKNGVIGGRLEGVTVSEVHRTSKKKPGGVSSPIKRALMAAFPSPDSLATKAKASDAPYGHASLTAAFARPGSESAAKRPTAANAYGAVKGQPRPPVRPSSSPVRSTDFRSAASTLAAKLAEGAAARRGAAAKTDLFGGPPSRGAASNVFVATGAFGAAHPGRGTEVMAAGATADDMRAAVRADLLERQYPAAGGRVPISDIGQRVGGAYGATRPSNVTAAPAIGAASARSPLSSRYSSDGAVWRLGMDAARLSGSPPSTARRRL